MERVNSGNVDSFSQVQKPEGFSGGSGPIYVHDGVVPPGAGAVELAGVLVLPGAGAVVMAGAEVGDPLALAFGKGNGPLTSLHAGASRALMMLTADTGSTN